MSLERNKVKTAFLSEMNFSGKIAETHSNMRTEFAWMCALQSDHFNIHAYAQVKGYDVVFIIFPKATVKLNVVGVEMTTPGIDRDIGIYATPIVETLKKNNVKICVVQEGPAWFFNEYDMVTQFNFYNQLAGCDVILAHNEYDTHFYKGLFPQTRVYVIPTLMYDTNLPNIREPDDKVIIGGNFARWYGGFQSYITATEFDCPIYVPASHCKRSGEEQVPNLKHLPWVMWDDWMKQLSSFKFAVNLMPTIAAGTFSMNCAYWGIPCIGNEKVDTQQHLFPELSIDVNDIHQARGLAIQLKTNKEFYEHCSYYAKHELHKGKHFDKAKWLKYVEDVVTYGGHDFYD